MSEKKLIFIVFILVFALISLLFSLKDFAWFFNGRYIKYAFESETPEATIKYDVENSIEIKKIGIIAPLVIPDGSDPTLKTELNNGVVYFPESAIFGQSGQSIILGHSAPLNWPKIKYDWVFNDLSKLEIGDEIVVYFNNQKYTYKVIKNYIISKGEDLIGGNSKNTLVLMSCWPPGKDYKRVAVEAEIVD